MSTEAEVVAGLAHKAAREPIVMVVADPMTGVQMPVLLAPDAQGAMREIDIRGELLGLNPFPARRRGAVNADTLPALVDMVNRHKSADTVIYAATTKFQPQIVAILNDHSPGAGDSKPGWRDHRVNHSPRMSEEWTAWLSINGKPQSQAEFAEFLEEHALDLVDAKMANGSAQKVIAALGMDVADPATIQGLARDFRVSVKQVVREAKSLRSGETQVTFVSEHTTETGQALVVPGAFMIGIPVFHGGPLYTIVVRLRYRLNDGKVSWTCKMARPDDSRDDAVKDLLEEIRKSTSCLVVEGTP